MFLWTFISEGVPISYVNYSIMFIIIRKAFLTCVWYKPHSLLYKIWCRIKILITRCYVTFYALEFRNCRILYNRGYINKTVDINIYLILRWFGKNINTSLIQHYILRKEYLKYISSQKKKKLFCLTASDTSLLNLC